MMEKNKFSLPSLSLIRIFDQWSKILALVFTQTYLVNLSLIRIFAVVIKITTANLAV